MEGSNESSSNKRPQPLKSKTMTRTINRVISNPTLDKKMTKGSCCEASHAVL
jgi:hypothetical protein